MVDTAGQAEIRGLNIDKLVKGFADEEIIFKKFCNVSKTHAREIRYYTKTGVVLTGGTTTGVTGEALANTSERAKARVIQQGWTRNSAFIRKYFAESETISMEDIKDSDIDVLAGNVRDIVRAVANQVDIRIYEILTDNISGVPFDGSTLTSAVATADGWDDVATGDPIADIMLAKTTIRLQRYDPEGAILILHPTDHSNLLQYLISVKGSSIPAFASEKVRSGVVMELLGVRIVVSANATTDHGVLFVPGRACTWKSFMPMTSVVIDDPGIGKKIRVWEEGEAYITDTGAVAGITDLQV